MKGSIACIFIFYLYSTNAVSHNNILHQIINHVNGTSNTIRFSNIETLLNELSFKNCNKEKTIHCSLCTSATQIYNQRNLSRNGTLSTNGFNDILKDILYLIVNAAENINSSAVCNNATSYKAVDVYNRFKSRYGNHSDHLDGEKGVEKILHDIKLIIGSTLTNKECFSAHEIIEAANALENSITEQQFTDVTNFIILNLLQRKCIKDNDGTGGKLPDGDDFVKDLFKTFGNKSHMSHGDFEKLVKVLKLGISNEAKKDEHDTHKRKKRSLVKRIKRSVHDGHAAGGDHSNDSHGLLNKCYSAENFLTIFDVPEGFYIDIPKFEKISPALIQQLQSGACSSDAHESEKEKSEPWKAWVASMVSILIICLSSLVGLIAIPFSKKKWFEFLIMLLIGLAVSVLIGDAIVHLFPTALGLHSEEEEGGHDQHEGNEKLKSDSFFWKSVCYLAGLYVFLTFETFMQAFGDGHSHSHGGLKKSEPSNRKSKANEYGVYKKISSSKQKEKNETSEITGSIVENRHRNESKIPVHGNPSGRLAYVDKNSSERNGVENDNNSSKDQTPVSANKDKFLQPSGGMTIFEKVEPKAGLSFKDFKSVAWLILIGDGIHNFLDGLAIGAAFSEGWPSGYYGGISTSIAIFCHELPSELGDFAVLVASGLSIKQALSMNFTSSLAAFLGGIVGCAIGGQWNATFWIFAITAGLFTYIALADMLPEALNSETLKKHPRMSILTLQAGLLIGFGIVLILGIWEDDIKTSVG